MALSETTLVTILVIAIGILTCMVFWKMIDNATYKSNIKRWAGCVGLKACKKGKDCGDGEVCYSGVCLSRKVCKAPSDKIQVQECSKDEKCMSVGDIGYCVPTQISVNPK